MVGVSHQLKAFVFLRKVVFGSWGALSWRSFRDRQALATQMFSEIASLESVGLGWENWEREKGDDVFVLDDPDEWKSTRWWM